MSRAHWLLSIAGHDPSGGAGLTTDLAAWQAMGLRGASVCTALTVQDERGVHEVQPTQAATFRSALLAACRGTPPAAIKLGMLGSEDALLEVAAFCEAQPAPTVWDTVLGAAAGGVSLLRAAEPALLRLARASTVITPNRIEAQQLLGVEPWQDDGAPPVSWVHAVRERWLRQGRTLAVVLKGGHAEGGDSTDWLCTPRRLLALRVPRVPDGEGGRVHGTGCTYASVLAGMLAQGADVAQAAVEAQWRTRSAIAQAWTSSSGRAMAHPAATPDADGFVELHDGEPPAQAAAFASLPRAPGLYPVLPDADHVLRALALGADTVQLRAKGLPAAELRAQLRAVCDAARERGAQLFVNDHWREALDAGAFGVHLGQEDLPGADLRALRDAGLRLGVSTHNVAEMARAHVVRPSYIALGPLWPTQAKLVDHPPLGLARLRQLAARCRPRYPVVAIGGITLERIAAAMDCGIDGVAVIGAVTAAADFAQALRQGSEMALAALYWREQVARAG